MILHPAIAALQLSSLLLSLLLLYSAAYGLHILRRWDISSGSELQLLLERRTSLISTVVACFLLFQLMSLFLFISTADSISHLFAGAMCAAGTLAVNRFGYPTLLLKIITFLLAGFWLIINHADNLGSDYPLLRAKYRLLALMALLVLAETTLQWLFFSGLRPDSITSCCGSLFTPSGRELVPEIVNAPPLLALAVFYSSTAVTCISGVRFHQRGTGGALFAVLSAVQFVVAMMAVISAVCLYIYQLPSHHCPFCFLQGDYYYVGYPLYGALLTAAITGVGAGWLSRYRETASLRERLPALQRTLTVAALLSLALVAAISIACTLFSPLTLR